jgi:hypothetical protein
MAYCWLFNIGLCAVLIFHLIDQPVSTENKHQSNALAHSSRVMENSLESDVADAVDALNNKLLQGQARLQFESGSGYLRSVLHALHIPLESQVLVFSKTSGQASLISPQTPRALFFNDNTIVGWVPGGFIEVADINPEGVVFYTLAQSNTERPVFMRRSSCLGCHIHEAQGGRAKLLVRSVLTAGDGRPDPQLLLRFSDGNTPFQERWGGWYVTGRLIPFAHLGNTIISDTGGLRALVVSSDSGVSLQRIVDLRAYPLPYSDVVALMIFDHQMEATNLLNQVARLTKITNQHEVRPVSGIDLHSQLNEVVVETVNALLFTREVPLKGTVRGSSGFAESFARLGPYDGKGRSLRQFNLQTRMMKFPCSYMIYSRLFESLSLQAKKLIYERMWQILSNQIRNSKHQEISLVDRRAVVEILLKTKTDLPAYFQELSH